MSHFDLLADGYTNAIFEAVNKKTCQDSGRKLINTARDYVTTYYKDIGAGEKVSEDDINYFLIDIVVNFFDDNALFEISELTKLLVLDLNLLHFSKSMSAYNSDYFIAWNQMCITKKRSVLTSIKLAAYYQGGHYEQICN